MRYKHFTKIHHFSLKKVILILLLISFNKSISQNKSNFEKEIEHPELYNSKDIDFIDS